MSYRGRPSKGCETCRARKVKVSSFPLDYITHCGMSTFVLFKLMCSLPHASCILCAHSHTCSLTEYTLTSSSVTKPSQYAIDVPGRVTSAYTVTLPISSFGIKLVQQHRKRRIHGEEDQDLGNEIRVRIALTKWRLQQVVLRSYSLLIMFPSMIFGMLLW